MVGLVVGLSASVGAWSFQVFKTTIKVITVQGLGFRIQVELQGAAKFLVKRERNKFGKLVQGSTGFNGFCAVLRGPRLTSYLLLTNI